MGYRDPGGYGIGYWHYCNGNYYVNVYGQRDCVSESDPTNTPPCTPLCVPAWVCESPLNGYEKDGCGNRRLNSVCNPVSECVAGAVRQVKCPDNESITITQKCVDGIWQTPDEEKAKCAGTGEDIMTWVLAVVIVIILVMIFYKR